VRRCWKEPSTLRLCRLGFGQRPGGGDVDGDADERDGENQSGAHRGWIEEPADAFVGDERGEDQQRHAVGLGGEDLDAFEAVGQRALRRA
jgi:hypothetical protein